MSDIAKLAAQLAVDPAIPGPQPMHWKPEVQTVGGNDRWSSNGLVFATEAEAKAYVSDLMWRWMQVTDTRVVDTSEPVNYRWHEGKAERIEP
jgi:hypothetical protein